MSKFKQRIAKAKQVLEVYDPTDIENDIPSDISSDIPSYIQSSIPSEVSSRDDIPSDIPFDIPSDISTPSYTIPDMEVKEHPISDQVSIPKTKCKPAQPSGTIRSNLTPISNKYSFVLKGINPAQLEERYGLNLISNINYETINTPIDTTMIAELSDSKFDQHEVFSFMDESKRSYKCHITMINYLDKVEGRSKSSGVDSFGLPKSKRCWWDHHTFNTIPIGCPIRYIPSYNIKSYISQITKEHTLLKEVARPKKGKQSTDEGGVTSVDADKAYYETDGVFCSFNCCMAYIRHSIVDPYYKELYKESEFLLKKLYFDVFGKPIHHIQEAPSIRLLDEYGGHLDIVQYRSSFNRVEYIDLKTCIHDPPRFKPIGFIFEKKIKL